jgi:hypothetical protein
MLGLFASGAAGAHAEPLCNGFEWDVSKELALFAQSASRVAAGRNPATAPAIAIDRLYEFDLTPQDQVEFALAPGKKMLTDGANAGLVALRVAAPGLYRVSVDVPFWIDVAEDGKLVEARDFQGQQSCNAPHKIVEFELSAGKTLIIQVSGSVKASVRLSVTKSPPAKA